jgi:hypothetical protein
MDRRLLFPIAAVTAWAQQPSPEAAAAEAALRARVDEFFKLQVDKKFRQAEGWVADDSKDDYYNGNKYNIRGFTIDKVDLLENNTRAKVLIKAQVTVMLPAGGPVNLEAPQETFWKVEDGKWVWYVLHGGVATPFGVIKSEGGEGDAVDAVRSKVGKAPDIATLRSMVKLDRSFVTLTEDAPQTVTLSNSLDGGIDIQLANEKTRGFTATIDKKHLAAGEKATIQLTADGKGPQVGLAHIEVSPLATVLEIQVVRK